MAPPMMSLEDALTVVQSGLTVAAIVLIVVFVRQQVRERRPSRPQLIRTHNKICEVAPWPHEAPCVPVAGQGVIGRMIHLTELSMRGVGRVDAVTGLVIDRKTQRAKLIELKEDEKCEGQD